MPNQVLTNSKEFCHNKSCSEYGKIYPENIRKFGRTAKGTQRYQCKTCKKVFVETIGTVFYGIQHSIDEVIECFKLLAERNSLAAIHRITGIKEETVSDWLLKAGKYIKELDSILLSDYHFNKIQIDALWTYVGNKGEKNGHEETETEGTFWINKGIDPDTRLRIGSEIDKEEGVAAKRLLLKLKRLGNPDNPPALTTDGRGGCRNAIKEIWGKDGQESEDWKYLQIIKHKIAGKLQSIETKIIYGKEDIIDYLGTNLAYIDRTHLTSRQMNGRLVRKTLSYSKKKELLEASCVFEDWVYNLLRCVRTLRYKENNHWKYISPAIKSGITDHIWTIEELLKTVVTPINSG